MEAPAEPRRPAAAAARKEPPEQGAAEPGPQSPHQSSSHPGQEEDGAETDFDVDTDVIEVIEIKQECQSPGPVSGHAGTFHHKQTGDAPVETLPANQDQMVHLVGLLNGEKVYKLPAGGSTCTFDVPHLKSSQPRKRNKVQEQVEENRPYIKKPLNAFMVFMREHRPFIDEEVKRKGNGVVNMHLAQTWKMMTKEQQAIYYQEAERQRQLHKQLYPEWSNGDNYGRKLYQEERRRVSTKSRGPRGTERSLEPQWTRPARASAAHQETRCLLPQKDEASLVKLSGNQEHILSFVGLLNGEKVYKLASGTSSSSPCLRLEPSQPRQIKEVPRVTQPRAPRRRRCRPGAGGPAWTPPSSVAASPPRT
uniref:HMG box domain-containing protein n=1 Tax=Tetraodon nigroviridis TaxID=99883 RepID=H3CE54_TETNG